MRVHYDVFTGALQAAGMRGRGSAWQCPAHEDRTASLSVKEENGGQETLFNCHAGCTYDAITGALDLKADKPEQNEAPEWAGHDYGGVTRKYPYVDEQGTLLYTVIRKPGKQFRQQAADGAWSLKGIRRVLYRLPEVLQAVKDGTPVHVVEGEKDTDALRKEGHVATCNSSGAKQWRDDLADSLTGASEVVVWQDKDEPGREWARQVSASLAKRIVPYRVVEAASGKDAYDHLAAGYAADQAVPAGGEQPTAPAQRTVAPAVAQECGPDGKPVIDVTDAVAALEWLRQEIGKGPLACIFRRTDGLIHTPRIGEDGYKPFDTRDNKLNSPAQIRRISEAEIKALIEHRYSVTKLVSKVGSGDEGKGQPKKRVGAFFPGQALASVVNSAVLGEGSPNLRALAGVTHTPLMRADGTILAEPGYDESTGLLLLPEEGLSVPSIPGSPTGEQIREAVKLILTPVEEFDFVSDHHRANWVGLMVTPVLRPLLPPPYQCGVMTAPRRGSGKTMLAELIMLAHGGQTRTPPDQDPSKLHNEILAVLTTTTAPVVTFDNVRGKFGSTTLEKLFTSGEYSGRKLGETLDVSVPNDRLWLATSNNATIGGDMDRRIRIVKVRPRLKPGSDKPEDYIFQRDPRQWMRQHRGEYLAALLTVARGWVVAGAPREDVRSDFYKNWVESLRGMLKWAGVQGLFAGEDVSDDVTDEDTEEWAGFLEEAHNVFKDGQFTVADVLRKAATPAQSQDAWSNDHAREFDPVCLPAEFLRQYGKDLTTPAAKSSLAKFFRYRLETTMGGFSLEEAYKSPSGKRATRYKVNNHRA